DQDDATDIPDAAAADREQLHQPCADLANIEAVHAESAKEDAKQQCEQPVLAFRYHNIPWHLITSLRRIWLLSVRRRVATRRLIPALLLFALATGSSGTLAAL